MVKLLLIKCFQKFSDSSASVLEVLVAIAVNWILMTAYRTHVNMAASVGIYWMATTAIVIWGTQVQCSDTLISIISIQ